MCSRLTGACTCLTDRLLYLLGDGRLYLLGDGRLYLLGGLGDGKDGGAEVMSAGAMMVSSRLVE